MRYALTNYGHRYLQHRARTTPVAELRREDEARALCELVVRTSLPCGEAPSLARLVPRGLVEAVGDEVTDEALRLRYARNPLEHLRRVVFEYTTVCNLDCLHCRNGNLEAHAEAKPERLRRVVDAMLPLGVGRFDFIGGEVTLYGRGWLDLVAYIRAHDATSAGVITSGWFLGERDFLAAARRYADDRAYLADLRARGLTHVIFSLDGPAAVHDRWRGVPGLHDRVLEGFARVREAGLEPRVSLVIWRGLSGDEVFGWMADVSSRLYDLPRATDPRDAVGRLMGDDFNYVSNFIDVGGAVQLRRSRTAPAAIPDEALRCKNFFRPSPTFRVKATGEVSLCPLVEGGDGYGNVHERDVVEILNHLQDALVYQLHAERRIADYRRHLDAALFAGVSHVCTLRTALNMLARGMHERALSPDDAEALRALNVEVAEKLGVLPRDVKHRANGHRRPGA